MNNIRRLGNSFSIPINSDEENFTGRECPQSKCGGYFKVEFGTGLKGAGLPCHCPYCGHVAAHDHFWTKEQIEYAKSVAARKITDTFLNDLKKMEFNHKPNGLFGIGISLKIEASRSTPIYFYREKKLETDIVCSNCNLRYSVYGLFAFCPDCGQHNSLQILDKNLEVVGKMLDLTINAEKEIEERLIENGLEDCVSAFDGFGRELCRINKNKAADPDKVDKASFQNLARAKSAILAQYHFDISAHLTIEEWQAAVISFQKRHLITHKLGVVDQDYIIKTGDNFARIGGKVRLGADEVRALIPIISKLARGFSEDLKK